MDREQFEEFLKAVKDLAERVGVPKDRVATFMRDVPGAPPSNPRSAEPTMWRAKDLAAFLQVSVSWVYKHTEAGDIPYHRKHGVVRYEPDEIRAWLKDRGDARAKVFHLKRGG